MSSRTLVLAALAVACTAAAGGVAQATPSGSSWTRISGPTGAGADLGLARTADGVLHVIWERGTSPATISNTRISPSGKTLGTATVAGGWDGNGGLALLTMPDGSLRLFVTGGHTKGLGSAAVGVNMLTAPASGSGWTLDPGRVWGGASAYSAGSLAATLTKDGQPVSAWAGAGLDFVHVGLDPSGPTPSFGSSMLTAELATDSGSGGVVLSGISIGHPAGTYVQQVLPSPGPAHVLPSATDGRDSGLAARIGAPGVYVAYTDGKTAKLYRYGGGTKTLARGPFQTAKVFAGPAGRLWIVWGDSNDGLFVTRSNKAVSAFEPVQTLKLPANSSLENAEAEGSAGPLDLFADVLVGGNDRGFWHTFVLARFSLRASVAKAKTGAKVTLSVRDAGDPVAGATVTVGGKHLKTDTKGRVSLTLGPGSYSASASAAGYAAASATFHV